MLVHRDDRELPAEFVTVGPARQLLVGLPQQAETSSSGKCLISAFTHESLDDVLRGDGPAESADHKGGAPTAQGLVLPAHDRQDCLLERGVVTDEVVVPVGGAKLQRWAVTDVETHGGNLGDARHQATRLVEAGPARLRQARRGETQPETRAAVSRNRCWASARGDSMPRSQANRRSRCRPAVRRWPGGPGTPTLAGPSAALLWSGRPAT